jgi:hypothetical protein
MNQHNFEFLRNQLKFTGFGEDISVHLYQKMLENTPDFIIIHKPNFGEYKCEVALYFKKSEHNHLYYFNRYFVQIMGSIDAEVITQSFRIVRGSNITLKEAFNLMNGRAVRKEMVSAEGLKYYVWLQLNFKERDEYGEYKIKHFHQNYGFDLEKALAEFPIKELNNAQATQILIRSLYKGNRQLATLTQDGLEERIYIEANPQFKSIIIYNKRNIKINFQSDSQIQTLIQRQTDNLHDYQGKPNLESNKSN